MVPKIRQVVQRENSGMECAEIFLSNRCSILKDSIGEDKKEKEEMDTTCSIVEKI